MTANIARSENKPAQAAVPWLRARLPKRWEVGPTSRIQDQAAPGTRIDAAIDIRDPNGTFTTMIVEVRQSFTPREIERLLGGMARTMRALTPQIPILVVAPWLSPRSQELLAAENLNYLDLTGNARIRLDNPTLFIETRGAAKDPNPVPRNKTRVQGPKAARLIRLLAEVRPPYGVRQLATVAGLGPGYVSRVLDTLNDEALIERSPRGGVESVDVPRLLRRWAQTYDIFRANTTSRFLAPGGANNLMTKLVEVQARVAVTGSFAAVRLAPVAGPALLVAYTDEPAALAKSLGLIPTDEGANVALLVPFDQVVWERTTTEDGITYVAPSQAAVDCLTGNGRMPAEGDALVSWMTENEDRWRLPSLPEPPAPATS